MKKEIKHSDLITYYREGDNADKSLYNEQRSNLMLVAGNHYTRRDSRFWNRVRESNNIPAESKIRITKNHVQRICKIYENNIMSYAPAVAIEPKNMSELQDQKAAELNSAVWADISTKNKIGQKTREWCQDYVRIGECATKVFWDESKGQLIGYEQAMHPETGEPMHEDGPPDEFGNPTQGAPIPDKTKPKFSGALQQERWFGFNIFRAKEAKSMDESWFIGYRKMVDIEELKARVGDDPEKLKFVHASRDETFIIFDGNNVTYSQSNENQCLLLEMYIRPSINHPNGYYYIYTNEGILWEGELPFGIFPVHFAGFDEVPTNPRYHSIIKHVRPYQAEINRMASSAVENSIICGQDKIITSFGNKIQNGGLLPGVRNIQVANGSPTILPGRTGEQWIAPMEQAIQEMYLIANIAEDMQEKPAQLDPYTMLFQTIEQKKKYVIYVTKFMQFLCDVAETSLSLYREYANEGMIIPAIGRSEAINIAEFKNTKPLCYQIKLDSSTEDMESKLGKQLTFNHIMQYVGTSLDPKQLGKMIRLSPYANNEQMFEDLTLDYDNGTNMILSLDRGQPFQPDNNDDSEYMMKRIVSRMRKADFKQLPPQIQQGYAQVYQQYVAINAAQQKKIQEAELGFIPQSGMAVVCDIYVPDPNNTSKTMRARVPYDSLTWLLKRLEEQGQSQSAIMQQQQGVIADVSQKLMQSNAQNQQMGAGENLQPQLTPQTMRQ